MKESLFFKILYIVLITKSIGYAQTIATLPAYESFNYTLNSKLVENEKWKTESNRKSIELDKITKDNIVLKDSCNNDRKMVIKFEKDIKNCRKLVNDRAEQVDLLTQQNNSLKLQLRQTMSNCDALSNDKVWLWLWLWLWL